MDAEGLVKRTPDPADRRARLIGITARGRRKLEEAGSLIGEVEQWLLSALDDTERQAFRNVLSCIAFGLIDAGDEPLDR